MKAAAEAAANRRLEKIVRSSIGALVRRSIKTHKGNSTAAAIRPAITTGFPQPDSPPLETPSTSPVRPTTNVAVPSVSKPLTWSGLASSRKIKEPQAAPAKAIGTLNQKTQCHEISTKAPPKTGPSTKPIAATIVLAPIAKPSCCLGKASVTRAAALANRKAEPIPCKTRQQISSVAPVEKPAPSEAKANTRKPPT